MITRMWRGEVLTARAEEYLEYLKRTGLADYASVPGNRGVTVLTREFGDRTEFLIVTEWDSWEAIRTFAGDDPEIARYYPEDDDFLLSRNEHVEHYETVFTGPASPDQV
jgi:heme-degrading monooxygenase HmoA